MGTIVFSVAAELRAREHPGWGSSAERTEQASWFYAICSPQPNWGGGRVLDAHPFGKANTFLSPPLPWFLNVSPPMYDDSYLHGFEDSEVVSRQAGRRGYFRHGCHPP